VSATIAVAIVSSEPINHPSAGKLLNQSVQSKFEQAKRAIVLKSNHLRNLKYPLIDVLQKYTTNLIVHYRMDNKNSIGVKQGR